MAEQIPFHNLQFKWNLLIYLRIGSFLALFKRGLYDPMCCFFKILYVTILQLFCINYYNSHSNGDLYEFLEHLSVFLTHMFASVYSSELPPSWFHWTVASQLQAVSETHVLILFCGLLKYTIPDIIILDNTLVYYNLLSRIIENFELYVA